MKIGQSPPLQPAALSPAQRRDRKDGDREPGDSFDALLEALKQTGAASPTQDMDSDAGGPNSAVAEASANPSPPGQRASPTLPEPPLGHEQPAQSGADLLHPKIGSRSQSFAEARLLVETSLELPRHAQWRSGVSSAGAPIRSIDQLLDRVRQLLAPISGNAAPPASEGPAPVFRRPPADARQTPQAAPDAMAEIIAIATPVAPAGFSRAAAEYVPTPNDSRQAPTEPPAPQAEHTDAVLSGKQGTPDDVDTLKASTPADARPVSDAGDPQGQQSRFAAQLQAAEGGLKVWVRIPKLDESERSDLEARLATLLGSFGHRRHELVIHEIANA